MQPTIEFVVEGRPVPWARAGQEGRKKFTPHKQEAHMHAVAWQARIAMKGRKVMTRAIHLRAQFVYAWPKSWGPAQRGKSGAQFKTSVPDADNLLKIIKDSLKGIVWIDDAQVYWDEAIKIWGTHDHTRIWIEEWPDE